LTKGSTLQTELRRFALVPNPEFCEQIVDLTKQRLPLVQKLASFSLQALPEEFEGISLDSFPEISRRSRLIRNMIASFIFRGNLSPFISSWELKSFVQMNEGLDLDQVRKNLISLIGEDNDSQIRFLENLFTQVITSFSKIQLPTGNDPRITDLFYRQFSRDLLVLDPISEEQTIITVPQRIKEGQPHLWEDGVRIGNLIIPSVDKLAQAARQAEIRGDVNRNDWLRSGIRNWQWVQEEELKRNTRVAHLEQQLNEREELLKQVDNPDSPLPKDAYIVIYETQARAQAEMRTTRRLKGRVESTIEANTALQQEMKQYREGLDEQYGENWPGVIPMPRRVFVERLKTRVDNLNGQQTAISRKLGAIENLLYLDFFWRQQQFLGFGFLQRDNADGWVRTELKTTQILRENPASSIHNFSEGEVSRILRHLEPYFGYVQKNKSLFVPSEILPYYRFWQDVYASSVRKLSLSNTKPELKADTLSKAIEQRINLLKFAASSLSDRKQVSRVCGELTQQIAKYVSDPTLALPEDATWSAYKARSYLDRLDLLKLPDADRQDTQTLIETSYKMRRLLSRLTQSYLPEYIPDRNTFKVWLENSIDTAREEIVQTTGDGKRGILQRQKRISIQQELLSFLDDPLTPISDEQLLSARQFIAVWAKKVNLIYTAYSHEILEEESADAEKVYQQIMRETFQERLRDEIESRKRVLEREKRSDLTAKFVGKMQGANLVLEENLPA